MLCKGIRIQNIQPGQIIMDIDLRWGGDPSIILAVDAVVASLPIQVLLFLCSFQWLILTEVNLSWTSHDIIFANHLTAQRSSSLHHCPCCISTIRGDPLHLCCCCCSSGRGELLIIILTSWSCHAHLHGKKWFRDLFDLTNEFSVFGSQNQGSTTYWRLSEEAWQQCLVFQIWSTYVIWCIYLHCQRVEI